MVVFIMIAFIDIALLLKIKLFLHILPKTNYFLVFQIDHNNKAHILNVT